MNNVKRVLVGIFALAVASTAFAATPVHTPTPHKAHKDQVLFQGKWRHVHKWQTVALPLHRFRTVRQVEKVSKVISTIRYGQLPFLYQMQGKYYLIWRN